MTYHNVDITFKCNGKTIQSLYVVDLDRISVPIIGDTVKLDSYDDNGTSSDGTFKVIDREFRFCNFRKNNFCTLNVIIKLEKITNGSN